MGVDQHLADISIRRSRADVEFSEESFGFARKMRGAKPLHALWHVDAEQVERERKLFQRRRSER